MTVADELRAALARALAETDNPGAAACVGAGDVVHFRGAVGDRQRVPTTAPAMPETIYDLASVTKVVATTTAVMLLRQEGRLDLDAPAATWLPLPGCERITPRHLLTHTAGFVGWKAYYRDFTSVMAILQDAAAQGLDGEPGAQYRYSDLGFMALGRLVELVAQDRLDTFCARRIFEPLGMRRTTFNPPEAWRAECAATEACAWRDEMVVGKVHDENAYAVGGVAGHAGLFSTIDDLAVFCRAMLQGTLLTQETVSEMTRIGQVPTAPWQGLGWRLGPWASSSSGYLPSRTAFGHPGFTGASVWMDRANDVYAVLLANTCHPSRRGAASGDLRRAFYYAVTKNVYADKPISVLSGLDRLVRDEFAPLRGKRVAVLTHHAAVDALGRPILDAFALAPDVRVQAIFSPEHGLRGQAEAGEHVPSEHGPIPVISLMGRRSVPTREELAGVDYLVVDMQDVGSRYYTYPATMKGCMRVCAEAGVRVLVLDRPNPTGCAILEGPIAEKPGSPVCWDAVPVRHGMTMAELAVFFAQQIPGCEVETSLLENWRRDMMYPAYDMPWIPPSPNLPTAESALIYVGTCLLEGVNLNEGRGTEEAFTLIGAPWIDPDRVLARLEAMGTRGLAGLRVEPAAYTPVSLPGKASDPRYRDEACRGFRIHATEPYVARPFRFMAALLTALRAEHPQDFAFSRPDWVDTLSGAAALRRGIEAGEDPDALVDRLEAPLPDFAASMPRLYSDPDA